MLECDQTSGMNMMEHGASVYAYFADLRRHALTGANLELEWKLPAWATDRKLWDAIYDIDTMQEYQLFHDCGKPFCRVIDDDGKSHFPNHAEVSEQIWTEIGGSLITARLIGMDMDIHLLKDINVEEFAKRPEAASLLLTGLAEIHSNAAMFGGMDSTSFKIKWKHINKRGNRITSLI